MKKIWQKQDNSSYSKIIEQYTTWNDYLLDIQLFPYDIKASKAHAQMLYKIGVLSSEELSLLTQWLDAILQWLSEKKFHIDISQEDWHTAIETFLTENYGEVGKKIHTWRSRNDQILVTMRLFTLDTLKIIEKKIEDLIDVLKQKIIDVWTQEMPGYTHTQKAMPTTVWVWLGMYQDAMQDTLSILRVVYDINNQNPLWSAAWYGDAWFWLERDYTTQLLWFSRTQDNPIYCGYSRWKFEYIVLQTLSHVMLDLWKLANELVYFSSSEFNFFTLPDSFKTGSSIMPQKKNWDIMELVRGNANLFLWYEFQLREIYKMLFMGYNRDFQLTKEPYLKWAKLVQDTLDVMILTIWEISINKEALDDAMTKELYATEEAYRLVKEGMSFRDAYIEVGKKYVI